MKPSCYVVWCGSVCRSVTPHATSRDAQQTAQKIDPQDVHKVGPLIRRSRRLFKRGVKLGKRMLEVGGLMIALMANGEGNGSTDPSAMEPIEDMPQ